MSKLVVRIFQLAVRTRSIGPMAGNLQRCIGAIIYLDPKPSAVLVGGDISHSGWNEGSSLLVELLFLVAMMIVWWKGLVKISLILRYLPPVECAVIETDIDGLIGASRLGEVVE